MTDRTIELPADTAATLAHRFEATEFETVDEYAAFVLDQVFDELSRQTDGPSRASDRPAEQSSSEAVESRLESLGYL